MKKLMSLMLVVLMVAAALPVAAMASYSGSPEGNTYGYAYDAQRYPAWPEKNSNITLSHWQYPYLPDGNQASSYAGSWTLTNQNTFAYCKSVGKSNSKLQNIVDSVSDEYGLTADNIIIHELKNNGVHVAYGVTIAYDASRGIAMFIGDSLSGGAGYVLSVQEVTDNSVTATANVSVGDWTPPPTYDITVNTAENGTVTAPVAKAMAGDTIKLTVSPAAGYELSSLTVTAADNSGVSVSGDNSFIMPAQAVTVSAGFSLKSYTVTYMADGVQVGTPVTVEHGKDVPAEKIPAIPAKTGYDKTAPVWESEGKNITADTTINAVYTINTYEVKYMADGVQVGQTQTVEHGKDAVPEAVPAKEGYMGKWGSDGKSITGDTTIEAVYTLIPVETPSEIPSTGDNSHVLLWGAVLVLTMTAAALIIGKKKYNT